MKQQYVTIPWILSLGIQYCVEDSSLPLRPVSYTHLQESINQLLNKTFILFYFILTKFLTSLQVFRIVAVSCQMIM